MSEDISQAAVEYINRLNDAWAKTPVADVLKQLDTLSANEAIPDSFMNKLAGWAKSTFKRSVSPADRFIMVAFTYDVDAQKNISRLNILTINGQKTVIEFKLHSVTEPFVVKYTNEAEGTTSNTSFSNAQAAANFLERRISDIAKAGGFEDQLKSARTRAAAIVEPAKAAPATAQVRRAKP